MTKKQDPQYGIVRSAEESGRTARAHRKNLRFTLETVSRLGNLSPCILRLKRDTDSENKGTVIPSEKGH